MSARVVIVEDEPLTRQSLAVFLRREGFDVREAAGVAACRAALRAWPADVVILDLGLPGEDAIAFAQQLRAEDRVAVLVITQDNCIDTKVAALETGADDYLHKPVHFRELAARVQNLVRRSGAGAVGAYDLGAWRIDLGARRVSRLAGGEEAASLTRGEFDLLAALVLAQGRVVTRDKLAAAVGGAADSDPRSVDALVSRIRRKLARSEDCELILTAPGVGYRCVQPARAEA